MTGLAFFLLTPHVVPARCRVNNANTRPRPTSQRPSVSPGLARHWRHKLGFAKPFRPSLSTFASIPEASRQPRRGLLSSVRLTRADKPLHFRPSPFPHPLRPFCDFRQWWEPVCSVPDKGRIKFSLRCSVTHGSAELIHHPRCAVARVGYRTDKNCSSLNIWPGRPMRRMT